MGRRDSLSPDSPESIVIVGGGASAVYVTDALLDRARAGASPRRA